MGRMIGKFGGGGGGAGGGNGGAASVGGGGAGEMPAGAVSASRMNAAAAGVDGGGTGTLYKFRDGSSAFQRDQGGVAATGGMALSYANSARSRSGAW